MTDATQTLTLSDSALLSRMYDNSTTFTRWMDRQLGPNAPLVSGAHLRECDGCAAGYLESFYQQHTPTHSGANAEAIRQDGALNYSSFANWRAYVDGANAEPPAPVDWAVTMPEDTSEVDAEIRASFPGAIPDVKLAKLRTLIMENKALKAQLNGASDTLAQQADAPIDLMDKRLWPAFGKVAERATEAGYCSEYDNMSEAGGFPTREELREAGYLASPSFTADAFVDVTVTYTTRVRVTTSEFNASTLDDAYDEARENITELIDDDDVAEAVRAEQPTLPYNGVNVEWELDYISGVDRA